MIEMLLVLTSGGGIATTVLGMEEGNGRELAIGTAYPVEDESIFP